MSLPRQVLPGQFYMITRRCTQRLFLLRPDETTNNAFAYCMADAARRTGVEVVLTVAMSNHHHTVIYDRYGRYPEFIEHFHKMLARCLNAYHGRFENLWSSEQCCVVHLEKRDDIIAKLLYVATNPVNAHLVDRARDWPGVNGYDHLQANTSIEATRPAHFFRATGKMPATLTLRFVVPPELGVSREALIRELDERIATAETDARVARKGRPVVGRRGVLQQKWSEQPRTRAQRFGLRPRIAARNKWARLEAIQRDRRFVEWYRGARLTFVAGVLPVPFPPGTYWLRRFAAVPVSGGTLADAPFAER